MDFNNIKVGMIFTGSLCTYRKAFIELRQLVAAGADVYTIFSDRGATIDTRFGDAAEYLKEAEEITGHPPILTIADAEPIGPKSYLDVMVIAPCTGNTAAKLCNGIVDSPALMAAKAHLRNEKPLVIAISTNDGLSMNLKNIGMLMNMKNIYFVPFGQDDYVKKTNSLVAHIDMLQDTIDKALAGKQIQPVVVSPFI
ncbi:MAG: dipicolinate synthase subunit B [Lachnospiraceae bacterium]|nr:dipicolinate synthase subunit B [Lachnospiraceae bacterium]